MTVGDADRRAVGKPVGVRIVIGIVHLAVTVVLLMSCLGLAQLGPLLTGHPTMSAAIQRHTGVGVRWPDVAVIIVLLANYAVFGVVAVQAAWRLIRARLAIGPVVTGCTMQVLLLALTSTLPG